MKRLNRQMEEWEKDPTLMRQAEQQAIGQLLGSGDVTSPTLDPMLALHLHYMSSRAKATERVLFLDAAANGSAAMWQLTHNALMLSHMQEQERESLLLNSGGGVLTSTYPLLGTPPYTELRQRLSALNKYLASKSTVTGGGALSPCVRQDQASGFSLRPAEVVGGGQLRHVINDDGTTATDTTPLEEYLSRQTEEMATHREHLMKQLEPLFVKVSRLEQEVKEKSTLNEVSQLRSHMDALATAMDNKVVELVARISAAERGPQAGSRFRSGQRAYQRERANNHRFTRYGAGSLFY